jgi:hypothetical protein
MYIYIYIYVYNNETHTCVYIYTYIYIYCYIYIWVLSLNYNKHHYEFMKLHQTNEYVKQNGIADNIFVRFLRNNIDGLWPSSPSPQQKHVSHSTYYTHLHWLTYHSLVMCGLSKLPWFFWCLCLGLKLPPKLNMSSLLSLPVQISKTSKDIASKIPKYPIFIQ